MSATALSCLRNALQCLSSFWGSSPRSRTPFHSWTCCLNARAARSIACCVSKSSRLMRSSSWIDPYTRVSAKTEIARAKAIAPAISRRTLNCRLVVFMLCERSEKSHVLAAEHLGERPLGGDEAVRHRMEERLVEIAGALGRREPEHIRVEFH